MPRIIFMNDRLVPEEQAVVSVFDHGLLYGDGVFEGLRSYAGNVFRLDDHLDRLYDSARAICLEIPLAKAVVAKAVVDTLAANNLADGYVRLVVTRGAGSLGLDPNETAGLLAERFGLSPSQARSMLDQYLRTWRSAGLLQDTSPALDSHGLATPEELIQFPAPGVASLKAGDILLSVAQRTIILRIDDAR